MEMKNKRMKDWMTRRMIKFVMPYSPAGRDRDAGLCEYSAEKGDS
jgi:hypothetical protein